MIDRERMRRLEELFRLGRGLSPEECEAFARRHLSDDPELLAELLALLAEDGVPGELLPGSAVVLAERECGDGVERVGRYSLFELIGEGGMGAVYRARQEEPVVREVALKILHAGEESPESVARFEAERQTLALMDHPGIARIFDGGTTSQGRPYLVMELVRGRGLSEHCERSGLSLRSRLTLLAEVCDAVQHAHQKGVIHRDLKPSNVLVEDSHGAPSPKLVDFGVACLAAESNDVDSATGGTTAAGSLAYMSPEQAAGRPADTRSDVYALGCMLVELASGSPLLDESALRGMTLVEVRRLVASGARPDPTMLAMPRELGLIARRATACAPADRYPTAEALGQDLRRHLAGEAVRAVPPTFRYLTRKLVSRYRVAAGAVVAAVLAVVAAIVGLSIGAAESGRRARDASAARVREAELRADAVREGERRGRALDFVLGVIEGANLDLSAGPDLTVRALLRAGGAGVTKAFADDPVGEVQMRRSLGNALHSLGDLERASEHLHRVLAVQEDDPSTPREETYDTVRRLQQIARDSRDQSDFDLAQRSLSLCSELVSREDAEIGVELAALIAAYVDFLDVEAGTHFDRLCVLARDRLPEESPAWPLLADAFEDLGEYLCVTEMRPEWDPLLREALSIRERLQSAVATRVRGCLVEALLVPVRDGERNAERHAEAEALARRLLAEMERTLPEGHWRIARAHSWLGAALSGQGRSEPAGELLGAAREELVRSRGPTSRPAVDATARWVAHLERVGDPHLSAARADLARALASTPNAPAQWGHQALAFDPGQSALLDALTQIATQVARLPGEAVEVPDPELLSAAVEVVAQELARLPPDSDRAVIVARQLGTWAFPLSAAEAEAARPVIECALPILRRAPEGLAVEVATVIERLGVLELADENPERARELAAEGLALLTPEQSGATELTLHLLAARADAKIGRRVEALAALDELLERTRATFGEESVLTREVASALQEVRGAG